MQQSILWPNIRRAKWPNAAFNKSGGGGGKKAISSQNCYNLTVTKPDDGEKRRRRSYTVREREGENELGPISEKGEKRRTGN